MSSFIAKYGVSRLIFDRAVVWVPDPNLVALGERGVETISPVDQPDATLRSLEDFVPEQWGLPPYNS